MTVRRGILEALSLVAAIVGLYFILWFLVKIASGTF